MIVKDAKLQTPKPSAIEKAKGKGLGQLLVSRKHHEQRPTAPHPNYILGEHERRQSPEHTPVEAVTVTPFDSTSSQLLYSVPEPTNAFFSLSLVVMGKK